VGYITQFKISVTHEVKLH